MRELRKARHIGWLDVKDIIVGRDFRQEIDQALRLAAAVVVILSPAACESEYVTYEWSFARGAGVPVVPLLVRKTRLHPCFKAIEYLDFTGRRKPWSRLIKEIGRTPPVSSATCVVASPTIYAEFELDVDHEPVMIEESYSITVGTEHVPDGTERVKYEILDETFEDRKWNVDWGQRDFEDQITSWGDVFITARGKGANGAWRTQSSLYDALIRRHGKRPPRPIREALEVIRNN
jgi:hypothetical protein